MYKGKNWLQIDNTQAHTEGWDLFDVDGRWQLQRIAFPADWDLDYTEQKFPTDADALIFVANLAAQGSAFHRFAIVEIGLLVGP